MNKQKIAKNLVENQLLKMNIDIESLVMVWSCYILGNSKYIFAVPSEGLMFEVTYNRERNAYYIDKYSKEENSCYMP